MNNKLITKIFGGIFIFLGIMVLSLTIIHSINWENKRQNHIEIYAYSNNGVLEYEKDGEKITPEQFYSYLGDEIFLNIPNKKSVRLYCEKEDLYKCVYFDEKNSFESSIINSPIISIFGSIFLLILGLFLVEKSLPVKSETKISYSLYFFWLWLGVAGLSLFLWQFIEYKNYVNLANQKNLVTASVYSEIYVPNISNDRSKIIAKYMIDGKEYTYVRKYFAEKNAGSDIKLYYDVKNPENVVELDSKPDIELIIISFVLIIISTPVLIKAFPFNKK